MRFKLFLLSANTPVFTYMGVSLAPSWRTCLASVFFPALHPFAFPRSVIKRSGPFVSPSSPHNRRWTFSKHDLVHRSGLQRSYVVRARGSRNVLLHHNPHIHQSSYGGRMKAVLTLFFTLLMVISSHQASAQDGQRSHTRRNNKIPHPP